MLDEQQREITEELESLNEDVLYQQIFNDNKMLL